jgi:hypothetical protein
MKSTGSARIEKKKVRFQHKEDFLKDWTAGKRNWR